MLACFPKSQQLHDKWCDIISNRELQKKDPSYILELTFDEPFWYAKYYQANNRKWQLSVTHCGLGKALLSTILWYSQCSTADAFGSEGSVAQCYACCITQTQQWPLITWMALAEYGWQRRPPGTNSSLWRGVTTAPRSLNRTLVCEGSLCLRHACAENTNEQWAKHGEGKVLSVSVSWWS